MPFPPPLPPALTDAVLGHLGLTPAEPSVAWLDHLVQQYGRRVPWESASRIARVVVGPRDEAPRLPDAFWAGTLRDGIGGTCFESNLALAALLASVGFDGALTINDMGETRACHTALVVQVADSRVIVDVGYPIYAALPFGATPTARETRWFHYDVRPQDDHYRIENHPHPSPYLFDFRDRPVDVAAYVAALRADYAPGGLFLDRLVIRRIVDDHVWRFASADRPWRLECFRDGRRIDHLLPQAIDAAASRIAAHFGLPGAIVATALHHVASQPDAGTVHSPAD